MIELASGIPHVVWIVPIGIALWLVVWRVKFEKMEQAFGLSGLAILVFAVSVWWLSPDWGALGTQAMSFSPPAGEPLPTYLFYAITLFAAAMTPYEVFFFSSGGLEEGWDADMLNMQRVNVMVGFPLGGILSVGIAAAAASALLPTGMDVETLGQVVLPVALCLLAGVIVVQTGLDPIMITEVSLVFSAVALPLTYLPVLIVANDSDYLGEATNGRLSNMLGTAILVVVLIAAVAAIPLMVMTGMGA